MAKRYGVASDQADDVSDEEIADTGVPDNDTLDYEVEDEKHEEINDAMEIDSSVNVEDSQSNNLNDSSQLNKDKPNETDYTNENNYFETDGEFDSPKIHMLPGDQPDAVSFEIRHEDHTLGNALRWMIMQDPNVEFCGYAIPHPAEAKLNLRIQTYDNILARDVLIKGLDNLMDLCDVVIDKFTAGKHRYEDRSTAATTS